MAREGTVGGGGLERLAASRRPNYFDVIKEQETLWQNEVDQTIRQYTTNEIYLEVNNALWFDDRSLLEKHRKFISLLRHGVRGYCESGTVYRGMKLPASQHELYTVGERFLWSAFTSTSRDRTQAEKFGSWARTGDRVLFVIELSRAVGLTFSRDISHFSVYPHEQEVLIFCYSGFEVLGREWHDGQLVVTLKPYDTKLLESYCYQYGPCVALLFVILFILHQVGKLIASKALVQL
ncbi:unnamed protein product [Effrenium voratum]|nr:unnamed protein product [Effrenium voratum]